MDRHHLIAALIALGIGLSSCVKDEIPIVYEPEAGIAGTFTSQVEMGPDYRYRLYYDIETDSVVAFHQKRDWDLAFQSEGTAVRLNSSKYMSVYRSSSYDIGNYTGFDGEGPLFDTSDGDLQGTVILADEMDRVYVIDVGYDADGTAQGFVKFSLAEVNVAHYVIRFGALGSTGYSEAEIPRDASVNNVMFSFQNGLQFLEPPKDSWDLLFTHYTHFFELYFGEESVHYLVSGALLNPNGAMAARVEGSTFETFDVSDAGGVPLSNESDVIGYDWKLIDLDAGVYEVLDNLYVIQTVEGNLYKLSFVGFYDDLGQQGAPIFRAAQLF
jgi:hypothetical protein